MHKVQTYEEKIQLKRILKKRARETTQEKYFYFVIYMLGFLLDFNLNGMNEDRILINRVGK